MKKTTLIVLLIAIGFGVAVYFIEIRPGKPAADPTADTNPKDKDTSTPAFSFKSDDIVSLSITRGGVTTEIANRDGKWNLTTPLAAPADQTAMDSMVRDLASARVQRKLSASADDLKSFGLAEPAVTVAIKLKDGGQQEVKLGTKDFSGLNVYAQISGINEAVLLPISVLNDTDKSADELRDSSVFPASAYDLTTLNLINSNGAITLAKQGGDWSLAAPVTGPADQDEVKGLITEVTTSKGTDFQNAPESDNGKYGLDKPSITLKAGLQGGAEQTLVIGSKTGEDYFARLSGRPQMFKVPAAVYEKLNVKSGSLRDKQIIKIDKDTLSKVRIKNQNLTLAAEKDKDGKWKIQEPADKKDKDFDFAKYLGMFGSTKASEVLDKPTPAAAAKLARAVVQLDLTTSDGKTTVLKISDADGSDVYVQIAGSSTVFKAPKSILDTLNFKADDIGKAELSGEP